MIIGVTGPMQSGKQEVGPVWQRLGFTWVDLNQFVDEVHRRDRDGFYTELGLAPIGLDEQGRERLFYYQRLYRVPGVHRRAQDHEVAHVLERLRELLPTLVGQRVVLSWGYTFQLLGHGIDFDHLFVFRTDHQVWCDRIRRAFQRLGWEESLPSNEEIADFARVLELDPDDIETAVASHLPGRWSRVDSTPDDWGEANLITELRRLRLID